MDDTPLADCVEAARKFVDCFSRRGKVSRVSKAFCDRGEIAGLNAADLGLSGIAALNTPV